MFFKDGSDEELFAEGDAGDRAYVIESGTIEIIKASGDRSVLLAVRDAGEVIGEMSLIEDAPRMASARARVPSRLLAVPRDVLDELSRRSSTAARALFEIVVGRLRSTTSMLRQSEKMAQLGTMTAGVAHELNNPASAVQRGAAELARVLSELESAWNAVAAAGVPAASMMRLEELSGPARSERRLMSALERSDLEAELEELLEDRGVRSSWELAPTLAEAAIAPGALSEAIAGLDGDALEVAVSLTVAKLRSADLLYEVGEGAQRISAIVRALKSYSFLDQAPVQEVDIHRGIEDTLLILRSKLGGLEVVKDFDLTIPKLEAWAGELNQVWTNLIDNAADVLEDDGGKIVIRTRADRGHVRVEVEDNGPGMPGSVREHVFEPFFTTKAPGKGTGLGLDISYRIVVDRHRGDMRVHSRPGCTVFEVRLPTHADDGIAIGPGELGHPAAADLSAMLASAETIAVVGVSAKPDRPSFAVSHYLSGSGYRVIPVNPHAEEIFGVPAVATLADVNEPVDIVVIFRPSEEVPSIVEEAIAIHAGTVWMQDGIINEDAARRAETEGLQVVMDTCIRTTRTRLMRTSQ